MPLRNKIQVGFRTSDDEVAFPATRYEHRIAIYPEAEREVLLDWHQRQSDPHHQDIVKEMRRKLADHWTTVADSAANEQRFLRAIDAYRHAIKYSPSEELKAKLADVSARDRRSNTLWFEGIRLKQERRLDEAITTFESLLAIEPNLARGHLELGTLLAAKENIPAGIKHLQMAAEFDANDPGPHAMLGWLEFLAKRPEAALEHYQRAAEIEPWGKQLEFMKGQCFMLLGRDDEAVHSFERTLEIDPHHRDASQSLCQSLNDNYAPADALVHASKGVELTSARRADLLILLAEIYVKLKQIPEATEVLAAARRAAQKDERHLLPQVDRIEKNVKKFRGR
jgi:tetratricopeptide (TPR) repeat protein